MINTLAKLYQHPFEYRYNPFSIEIRPNMINAYAQLLVSQSIRPKINIPDPARIQRAPNP